MELAIHWRQGRLPEPLAEEHTRVGEARPQSSRVVLGAWATSCSIMPTCPSTTGEVTLYRLMRQLLHRYDHTRLTTVAMHPRYRNIDTDSLPADLAVATEVNSYNYRYMYFPGDMKRYPERYLSKRGEHRSHGPNFFEMELDKVMGLAYWGAVDYLGESLGWPLKGWNKGVFDMTMLPKPDAYFVKSMFSDEPLVHIGIIEKAGVDTQWNGINVATQRLSENWNRSQGEQLSLYTYTNADEVELLLNGMSLGVRKNDADSEAAQPHTLGCCAL